MTILLYFTALTSITIACNPSPTKTKEKEENKKLTTNVGNNKNNNQNNNKEQKNKTTVISSTLPDQTPNTPSLSSDKANLDKAVNNAQGVDAGFQRASYLNATLVEGKKKTDTSFVDITTVGEYLEAINYLLKKIKSYEISPTQAQIEVMEVVINKVIKASPLVVPAWAAQEPLLKTPMEELIQEINKRMESIPQLND